jgi:hypothetical protein
MTSKEDRVSHQDPAEPDQVDVETWLGELGAFLPAGTLAEAGLEERAALLDLVQVRPCAPTWCGEPERGQRTRSTAEGAPG